MNNRLSRPGHFLCDSQVWFEQGLQILFKNLMEMVMYVMNEKTGFFSIYMLAIIKQYMFSRVFGTKFSTGNIMKLM